MKTLLIVVALLILLAAIAGATSKKRTAKQPPPTGKNPLTDREQAMYWRLVEARPDDVVLAQVALSALLDSNVRATRNTFDRKVADFVICDRSFKPLAVVELDDGSHRGKERRDDARDRMLKAAGYRTVRFRNIPDLADAKRILAASR